MQVLSESTLLALEFVGQLGHFVLAALMVKICEHGRFLLELVSQGPGLPVHVLQFTVARGKLLCKPVVGLLGWQRVRQNKFGIDYGNARWLR
ncbi:hypothetical protein GCM10009078_15340 [Cupriavidus gilardii]